MPTIPTTRRDWLFQRQRQRCYICSGIMLPPGPLHGKAPLPPTIATRDHVLPRSTKSKGESSLILLACRQCNAEKGATAPTLTQVEFAQRLHAEWIEVTRAERDAEKEARRKERAHRINQAHFQAHIRLGKQRRRARKRHVHAIEGKERAR